MNRLFFKSHIPLIVSVCLATIPLPTLRAEPHCPGNVASLPLRLVNRHLIVSGRIHQPLRPLRLPIG